MQDQIRQRTADNSRDKSGAGRCSTFHRLKDLAESRAKESLEAEQIEFHPDKESKELVPSESAAHTLQSKVGEGLLGSLTSL